MLTWIFDLDNTLHDASPHIFPHINRSMTRYLQEHLALDEATARNQWRRGDQAVFGQRSASTPAGSSSLVRVVRGHGRVGA